MRNNGRAALDSRGCLPHVAAQAGGGGATSCSSRNGSSPLLARSAKQGGGRASSLHKDHAATVAGARHVPVSRTVLVESVCRQGGTTRGQCRRDAARRVWLHSAAGTRRRGLTFKKPGMALPATLSLTRAPPRLWWARCSRTSTYVIVPRRAA